MNGSILALSFTSEDVKLAEIGQEDGARIVETLYHYRAGNETEEGRPFRLSEAVKELIQERPPSTLRTLLIINSQDLHYRDFYFPFDSRKKVSGAIRFEIASEFPPDEFLVDHIESISSEPKTKAFLAAIASKEVLERRVRDVEEAGLQIVGITSDLSTLGHYVRDEDEAFVMEIGETQTLFALYAQGIPLLVRGIPIGMRQMTNGAGGSNSRYLRPIVGEIKRTIHSFNAKAGLNLDTLYVSGDVLAQQGILESLHKDLTLRFVDRPPPGIALPPENARTDPNMYASVVGAAAWSRKDRSFDFFRDELVKAEPIAIGRSYLRWGAIMLAALLFTFLFALGTRIIALDKRKDFLESEIRATFVTSFPQTKRIVDEVRQAKNFLTARKAERVGDTFSKELSILDAMSSISERVPKGTPFEISNLFWERGKLEMNGKTDSFKTVNVIQELLSDGKGFSDVNISNAKMRNDGQEVEFRLTLQLAE
jgi:Tfp pilus assembly protein PilN